MRLVNDTSANPMKAFKKLDEALEVVGFNVEIPKGYKIKEIYVISGKVLEIRFAEFTIRKAVYKQGFDNDIGISGVYAGGYPGSCVPSKFSMYAGQQGVTYWNLSSQNPKAYLSIWNVESKYSYSIYAKKGINLKKMEIWQSNFR